MLKKLSIVLTFLICTTLFAQETAQTKVEIVIGPTISRIFGDDIDNVNNAIGLQGGVLFTVPTSSKGGIRIGALFNQKGFKAKEIYSSKEVTFTNSYFTMPVHIMIEANSSTNFYIGPEVSFLINSKASLSNTTIDIEDGINKVDVAVAGGFQAYLTEKISLSAGVSVGFFKVIKNSFKNEYLGQNLSIPITLGITI